jgi:hypothetical protein
MNREEIIARLRENETELRARGVAHAALFGSRAKVVIESWRRHYNEVRPHSSLGYLTPAAFVAGLGAADGDARAGPLRYLGPSPRPVASSSRQGQQLRAVSLSS